VRDERDRVKARLFHALVCSLGWVASFAAMDIQQFWRLIDTARGEVADSAHTEAVAARATILLSALPPEEIIAAQRVLSSLLAESYQTLLWAAAYLINGGCSDDGFEDFRGWLIAQAPVPGAARRLGL
jgi:Protein of unknown function (DUF4240)